MPNLDKTLQSRSSNSLSSVSSSGSLSPTPSSGSNRSAALASSSSASSCSLSLSCITTSAMTADIRITYSSVGDNGSPGAANPTHLTRPEVIALIDQETLSATGSLVSSPGSDCISSNLSLNSPGALSLGSPKVSVGLGGKALSAKTRSAVALGFDSNRLLSISRASSMDEGCFPSPLNSPARSTPSSPIGPKYKIIHEGDIHLCRLNHQRTVISKILSSKFLRRWENHRLYLTSVNIASKTPVGFMEVPIPYNQIEDVYSVSRWDSSQKFYIRIVINDGSVLLQLPNKWVRDQWLNSINWKRCMLKFQRILANSSIRPDKLTAELKNLIELTLTTPLQDACIYQTSLEIINELINLRLKDMQRRGSTLEQQLNSKKLNEEIIMSLSPLLEKTNPTVEICLFLSRHCRMYPRSAVVCEDYSEIVQRILKHSLDFGKYPYTRVLVQDYFLALAQHNDGSALIKTFIRCVHGFGSTCPHPRVVSNIVSVCLATLFSLFEYRKVDSMSLDGCCGSLHDEQATQASDPEMGAMPDDEWQANVNCFVNMLVNISQFEDWRPTLAQILQPIPFPDSALSSTQFTQCFKAVIVNICSDERCDVHQAVLGLREDKTSWLSVYTPGGIARDDKGETWSFMLKSLTECCCRRKRFYQSLSKSTIDAIMLLALRDDNTCQRVLADLLEMEVFAGDADLQQQIITTLESTEEGSNYYEQVCQRQLHLKQLQKEGGPRKLILPTRSTDADLARLLSSAGSFGNLECLSLAFTQITSASAQQLIKLSSLRYLNLWSTQFSDAGLQIISEHLPRLQVLNLCETPVTDRGISYLAGMKSLRKLNLNSTHLSPETFDMLKKRLPALQQVDVRYTDAW